MRSAAAKKAAETRRANKAAGVAWREAREKALADAKQAEVDRKAARAAQRPVRSRRRKNADGPLPKPKRAKRNDGTAARVWLAPYVGAVPPPRQPAAAAAATVPSTPVREQRPAAAAAAAAAADFDEAYTPVSPSCPTVSGDEKVSERAAEADHKDRDPVYDLDDDAAERLCVQEGRPGVYSLKARTRVGHMLGNSSPLKVWQALEFQYKLQPDRVRSDWAVGTVPPGPYRLSSATMDWLSDVYPLFENGDYDMVDVREGARRLFADVRTAPLKWYVPLEIDELPDQKLPKGYRILDGTDVLDAVSDALILKELMGDKLDGVPLFRIGGSTGGETTLYGPEPNGCRFWVCQTEIDGDDQKAVCDMLWGVGDRHLRAYGFRAAAMPRNHKECCDHGLSAAAAPSDSACAAP